MASDYQAIRRDNERRYGTDIGRIGPILLADRYDDRTHFIYELLQNAEDALARRRGWTGQRSVRFHLTGTDLRVIHSGKPFDEADVRGICGIAEGTKDLTAIGRFGIGFKSVYAFTDRPRIHSGSENFAIENFVWPVAVPPIQRSSDETVIVIPLRSADAADRSEITVGLQHLGVRTLLFLRYVEEIEWIVDDGPSGLYLRGKPERLAGDSVRRVTLLGQAKDEPDVEETWLVFSRPVNTDSGTQAGYVELAFLVTNDPKLGRERVLPVPRSPLVVFFPTVLETNLGFLLQGPYRTTPSRDNVPRHDPWNQRCVQETAEVLSDALFWLRDNDLLDTEALRSLPLDREKFDEDSMFAPLFEATRRLLSSEALLPRAGGGYTPAAGAKLARTQDLRDLFNPSQLSALFGGDSELSWLSGDISRDRTPELREYLMQELEIAEVTPETILGRLTADFLCAQPDEWILRLYEFLGGQPSLLGRASALPLVRLTDGTHVPAVEDGQAQAFLPGETETGFPTVRPAVCASEAALEFLKDLGLTKPDPVDDVIRNVLPRYCDEEIDVADEVYEADIRRILSAYSTDSKTQREKLIEALRDTPFVIAADAAGGKCAAKPREVYLATERLKELFAGVSGVLLVDDRCSCLRGEAVRDLLEACGAVRYLRFVPDRSLSWEERQRLREEAGHAETSGYKDRVTDWMLYGLPELLEALPKLSPEDRRERAKLLWEELAHLEERRGKRVFTGEYTWTHYGSYRTTFDAAFVRLLNETAWVPDGDGNLKRPDIVLFESLGWKPNPFLESRIHFKPPVVDQLAREAGFEPGALSLLKELGITSEAQLRELLRVEDKPPEDEDNPSAVADALEDLLGDAPPPTPPIPDPSISDPTPTRGAGAGARGETGAGPGGGATRHPGGQKGAQGKGRGKGQGQIGGNRTPGTAGGQPFISYVAAHANDEEPDPDGLDHTARMALEESAIEFIRARESEWRRTPTHNPGFDLIEAGPDGEPTRWCEVKAMTGTLHDRPVGLSRTQFECAREHGNAYWLYVVERAGTNEARIVRIQDPAGRARTFTFDRGWLAVAEVERDSEQREE